MDRPKISRLIHFLSYRQAACLLLLLCSISYPGVFSSTAVAQDPPVAEGFASEKKEPEPINKTLANSSGLYFGHVLFIQAGRYIFVRPTDSEYSRKTFYLDSLTRYSKFIDGLRKRARSAELVEGQKVAVRYFAGEKFAVADEIFLVDGEFEPNKYGKAKRRSKKRKSTKKDKAEESGEEGSTDEESEE